MPTLEALREAYPALKLYQVRALLKEVTCYRCPDQSVRYVSSQAAEAMKGDPPTAEREDEDDEDEDDDLDEDEREPASLNPLIIVNELLKVNGDQRRQTAELMKVYESAFRAMVEPMQVGCSMLVDCVKELRAENAKHESRWTDVVRLVESLSTTQHERDLEREKQKSSSEFRKGLGEAVIAQLPMVIDKLSSKAPPPAPAAAPASSSPPPDSPPPGEGGAASSPPPAPPPEPPPAGPSSDVAALAVDALVCLEPEFFESITRNLEPEQVRKWSAFKSALGVARCSACRHPLDPDRSCRQDGCANKNFVAAEQPPPAAVANGVSQEASA